VVFGLLSLIFEGKACLSHITQFLQNNLAIVVKAFSMRTMDHNENQCVLSGKDTHISVFFLRNGNVPQEKHGNRVSMSQGGKVIALREAKTCWGH
jgi:hypothetical protein